MSSDATLPEPLAERDAAAGSVSALPATAGVLAAHIAGAERNNFNLIRLLAAVAVIYGHSFALSANPAGQQEAVLRVLPFTYSGALAVAIFFLISGIFVTASLHRDNNIFAYAVKRIFRLWPGLVVCLGLSFALAAFLSDNGPWTMLRLPESYAYVLRNQLLDMQWTIPGVFEDLKYPSMNGSLWSLVIEARMYLLVLLFGLAAILRKRRALLAGSFGVAALILAAPDVVVPFVNVRSTEVLVPVMFFLAGMALFALRDVVRARWWHLAGLLVVAVMADGPALQVAVYTFVIVLTLWIGCSPMVARLPRPRGDYSYGLYIYGFPVQQTIVTAWPEATPYAIFPLALAIVLPLAMASWHLVELPGQNAGRAIARRLAGRAPAEPMAGFLRINAARLALPCLVALAALGGLAATTAWPVSLPEASLPVSIVSYGPTPVSHGRPFNVQPSGRSAIWVRIDGQSAPDMVLALGETRLTTVADGDLLTAAVPATLFAHPAVLPLSVEALRAGVRLRSPAVSFPVE